MRVRMKVDVSGARNGEPWPGRGEDVEVPDAEGADLCAAGMAEPVVEDKTEKAIEPEAEKRAPAEKADEQAAKRSPGRPRKPAQG